MPQAFPHLFSPFRLRGVEIRNRILSTGHDTDLGRHGLPSEALIAYQRARAVGGVGLIIVQVVAVHETARYTSEVLMGTSDDCIPAFRPLFATIREAGAAAFVQLFHPGRELLGRQDGIAQAAYAPSSAPSERFRIAPRALSGAEVEEIVEGYGQAARRMAEAGAQGVEIVASHGYLPAQFLNPLANRREDRYGGSPEKRLRFLEEVVAAVRRHAPAELILGLRLSGDEYDAGGIEPGRMLAICRSLKDSFDYFNVIAGTSASSSGAIHIVPPMSVAPGYMAPFAAGLKQAIGRPVFVAGRINQPQEAERILSEGGADMCGMTRALISDPEMALKAEAGRIDDIRACIACNQACIGHAQLGLSISCIQHPETGRELEYARRPRALRPLDVMVVGGGPGGMKAAAVAAECGHRVTLYERRRLLGGHALLAQMLPHRAEFGGIVTNLAREMALAGVSVRTGIEVDAALIAREKPGAVILAAGSRPRLPEIEDGTGVQILHAHELLEKRPRTGQRVVVYDWMADWAGVGLAEQLAADGAHVRLAVNAPSAAYAIQNYTRDAAIARLFKLEVEVIPFMRLFGAADRTAYFVHTPSQAELVMEQVDTIVVVYPGLPEDGLVPAIQALGLLLHIIGDALAPRTAEEAVFEGLKAATALSR